MAGTMSPREFASKIKGAAAAMEGASRAGVDRAALLVKQSTEAQMRIASGGDLILSRVGSAGAKIGVRYDVKGEQNPTALVYATGPVQLIERDTSRHTIIPSKVGRAKGRTLQARRAAKQELYDALFGGSFGASRPLSIPGIGPRYRAAHPGTRGKHPFQRGVEAVQRMVPVEFHREVSRALDRWMK